MCVAPNIESALQALTAPEDADRRRLIKEKTKTLSIDAEQARIREYRAFVDNIRKVFEGTVYEAKTSTILKFVEGRDVKLRRQLYTGALHEFGRKDGGEIYRMLKNVI